ncbi:hypothetical protein P3T36_005704 [Kitasatospora sp. MAP12-15]|uniref:hypothetical protein n=1 Tax=unclassified Kitasatospora TaxID=2633591 RepID=UPI0024731143|nr:hypothetical protein [Kitasatospora sp. MAP12-44]MDH6113784.1 hypothetical protein [Kitasatospora sp. MAP12-44]
MSARRGWAVLVAALAMVVPWALSVSSAFPATITAYHWTRTWLGFDYVLTGGLALTGWFARRADRRAMPFGVVTGTLLLIDAWFDVCTSPAGLEFGQAVVDSFFEVSGALLCFAIALRAAAPGAAAGGGASTTIETGTSVEDPAAPLRDR